MGTYNLNRSPHNSSPNLLFGTKYYAYKLIAIEGDKRVCKVRGITLNYHASQLVTFDVIRAMILEQGEPNINVPTQRKFKRKRKAGEG